MWTRQQESVRLWPPGALSRSLSPMTSTKSPAEIASGVFCIGPHGRTQTNVYLVRAGSTWALVDAGWAGDFERIQAAVRGIVGSGDMPSAILATHAHPDHTGAAWALAEAWHCPILLHELELPLAGGDFAAMNRYAGPLDRYVILPTMRVIGKRRREAALSAASFASLVRPLPPGGRIPELEGWRWIATPGHTPGHVSFLRSADRIILSGDALVTLRVNALTGFVLGRQGFSGPPWYTTWNKQLARASVRRLAAHEPSVVAGGHGRPMAGPETVAALRKFAATV
jgi:glyoxylase-like metal-dependent hydrolase (beta-lactamase superfamily II)